MRKRKRLLIVICSIVLLICILYFLLVNFLVSAALVPSFMEKLEAFERITDESYAAQVQTSDIKVNRQLNINETKAWLEYAEYRKLSAETDDGYILAAVEFPADEDSHKWALVLHGYTGWKEEMYPFASRPDCRYFENPKGNSGKQTLQGKKIIEKQNGGAWI